MQLRRKQTWVAALLVTCLLAFVAEHIYAQNPTVKGRGKLATVVQQQGTINAGSQMAIDADILDANSTLVPLKMTMVITDVIVSNANATASASFQIIRAVEAAASLTHMIEVGPQSTFSYNFGTGLEFPAGSRMNVFATGQPLGFTVTGYLRKGT